MNEGKAMNLVYGRFEGNTVRIEDKDAAPMNKIVAEVFGLTMEEVSERKPSKLAKLFAGSPHMRDALQAIVDQAEAQFRAGDRHATFSKVQIAQFKEDLRKAVSE